MNEDSSVDYIMDLEERLYRMTGYSADFENVFNQHIKSYEEWCNTGSLEQKNIADETFNKLCKMASSFGDFMNVLDECDDKIMNIYLTSIK